MGIDLQAVLETEETCDSIAPWTWFDDDNKPHDIRCGLPKGHGAFRHRANGWVWLDPEASGNTFT